MLLHYLLLTYGFPLADGTWDLPTKRMRTITVTTYGIMDRICMFTPEERVDFIRRSTADLPNVEVDFYDGLLAEYVEKKGAVAIVKGLRVLSDYEDEFKQALTNKKLAKNVETIFMVTDTEYMFLSSSVVKEVCSFGGDISDFVPAPIKDDIVKRIRER